jgi:Helix-turn-helix domain
VFDNDVGQMLVRQMKIPRNNSSLHPGEAKPVLTGHVPAESDSVGAGPSRCRFHPGDVFNPYRMFNALFIPEGLARCPWISAGAKLAWGRLARYAGVNGVCHPAVTTLAEEIGVSARQAQRYLAELRRFRLIRRIDRFADGAQTTNSFEFLWHELFEQGMTDTSGEGTSDPSPRRVTDTSPKESHCEESHSEELNTDIDYTPRSRKQSDSKPDVKPPSLCRRYPKVQECLAQYMQSPGEDKEYPTERMVVDIMNAAGTHDEQEMIECLNYLYSERGLKPFTKHGPRSFAWFKTVVQDYFSKKRDRDEVANPSGYHEWKERNEARLGAT